MLVGVEEAQYLHDSNSIPKKKNPKDEKRMLYLYSEDYHEVAASRSKGVKISQQRDVDDDAEAEQIQQALLAATAGEVLDQTNVGESWVHQASTIYRSKVNQQLHHLLDHLLDHLLRRTPPKKTRQ